MAGIEGGFMGKKGACALLALAFAAAALLVSSSAWSGEDASAATYTENGIMYTLTDVAPYEAEVSYCEKDIATAHMPSTVNDGARDYKVTSIGDSAFYECASLTSVTIQSGVTSIGNYAFSGCASLTSVTIPDSVTSIGDSAFYDCKSLTSVTIPSGVTSIGIYAFYRCASLTSVTIPDSVTSIGNYAFYGCASLTGINVDPTNPTYSSADGILYNKGMTLLIACPGGKVGTATIPSTVTSIGNDAFSGCASLTGINVDPANPNYVSVDGVLYKKDMTMLIACPGGKAGTATILSTVTSIGYSAFSGCASLTSLTIPSSVTSIGLSVFSGCTSLTEIIVDSGNTGYSSKDGILYNKDMTVLITCPDGKAGTVTIPDSVTSIGNYAFDGCASLTEIRVDSANLSYRSGDGILYSKNLKHLILCPRAKTSVTIPYGVTAIDGDAFIGCSGITSLTIPSTVTKFNDAFEAMTFYDSDGKTVLPKIPQIIAGHTFTGTPERTVLVSDAGASPDSTMTYVGIAAAAVAAIAVAAVMADYFFLRRR